MGNDTEMQLLNQCFTLVTVSVTFN